MVASLCDFCTLVILLLLGLLQLHGLAVLLWQFCHPVILVREREGHVFFNTILERKGPGLMPLSGLAPLSDGFVASFHSGQLTRVVLEMIGLK